MSYLIIVSLLWAFSFGLIKGRLVGLDPSAVAFMRLSLSAVVFAPFLRWGAARGAARGRLMGVGALQYGLMYVLYIASYRFLQAHQIALFTATTPLYVVLLADLRARRWRPLVLLAAVLAVAGAVIVVYLPGAHDSWLWGLLLVQGANLCFAAGQLMYRGLATKYQFKHRDVFGWMYLGAAIVAGSFSLMSLGARVPSISGQQLWVIVYLGVVSSGVGFFLWNVGATRVSTGVLAVFNNVKVPLAVAASVIVFGETVAWGRLLVGATVMAVGLWLAREPSDKSAKSHPVTAN